jgi:hypothetical protein
MKSGFRQMIVKKVTSGFVILYKGNVWGESMRDRRGSGENHLVNLLHCDPPCVTI